MSASLLCTYALLTVLRVQSVIVNTTYGAIDGTTSLAGDVNMFYKIPFAQPPIDALRFAAPQEPNPWEGTRDATGFPHPIYLPACMQTCSPGSSMCPESVTEDCLYLNVFAPANAEYMQTNYSVMIWIYGGSFFEGWGTWFFYDPTNFVSYVEDVIIVTINYRLGLFGFFYDNTYDTGLGGNYGYLDQQLAIKWVYENIQYFGGNQNSIALFGESAGAMSVGLHLLYNDDGYFRNGIMQSNPFGMEYRSPSTWYDVPQQLTEAIGCDNVTDIEADLLDCWRSVEALTILAAQSNPLLFQNWYSLPFTPTVDTDLLPEQPILAFQSGNYDTEPFIAGYNTGEQYLFTSLDPTYFIDGTYNFSDLRETLTNGRAPYFAETGDEDITDRILAFHEITPESSGDWGSYVDAAAEIYTYWLWACPTLNVMANAKSEIRNDVYLYEFGVADPVLGAQMTWPAFPKCWDHACHVNELNYVLLQPLFAGGMEALNNGSIAIGEQLQVYWSNYAKSMDPNLPFESSEVWPNVGSDDDDIDFIEFFGDGTIDEDWIKTDGSVHNGTDMRTICDFYDSVGYSPTKAPTKAPTFQPTKAPTLQPIEQSTEVVATTESEEGTEEPVTDSANTKFYFLAICVVVTSLFVV